MNNLILEVLDDFTGKIISSGISINCNKPLVKITKNKSGYIILSHLNLNEMQIKITKQNYLKEILEVNLSENTDFKKVVVRLKPSTNYNFSYNTTLIRGKIPKKILNETSFVGIKSYVYEKKSARFKVMKDVAIGENDIYLKRLRGKFTNNSCYKVFDTGLRNSVYLKLKECEQYENRYLFENSLNEDINSGALLLPAVEVFSDENGEFVIYFKNIFVEKTNVVISFECDFISDMEVSVEEGQTLYVEVEKK